MHAAQSNAIAELAGKVEHMQRDSAAQLSHFIERFDRMEHQIAAAVKPQGEAAKRSETSGRAALRYP
jgi:hypothetical protein